MSGKRAVGYIRVSTGTQAQKGESLDTQREQIEARCKYENWELIEIYEDAGISGCRAEDRPSFMKMVSDAKKGKFDIVVFTKLSRFARNARDYYNFQHEFEQYKVSLVSIKENINPTTHNGKLMAGIFALLADWEREMIQEQMAENKLAKWRDKRMFNGQAPYGYYWDKEKCEFIANKEESEILLKILKWYAHLPLSMKDLVLKLKEEGYKSRRAEWSTSTINYILSNPCYRICKLDTNTRVYKNGKRTKELKERSEWITYDLPRIVPLSLLKKADQKRKFNTHKQKRTSWQIKFWLRDSLRCMDCGGRVKPKRGSTRKDGTFPGYYACYWGNCSPKELKIKNREKCPSDNLPAYDVESYVWDLICFTLTGSHRDFDQEKILMERAEKKFKNVLGEGDIQDKLYAINEKMNRLKGELNKKYLANNRLMTLLENEGVSLDTIGKKLRGNEQDIEELKERISICENEKLEFTEVLKDQKSFEEGSEILFSIWSDLQDFNPEDKKRMVEALVPEGINIKLLKGMLGPSTVGMNLVWNPFIFRYFKENGKFPLLNKNGYNSKTCLFRICLDGNSAWYYTFPIQG